MPPFCSMVRIARVQSRIRTDCPRTSDSSEASWRLGRKRRRVRLLAWLTLLPVSTPLPVIWQRRDIAGDLYPIGSGALWRGGADASSMLGLQGRAVLRAEQQVSHGGHRGRKRRSATRGEFDALRAKRLSLSFSVP